MDVLLSKVLGDNVPIAQKEAALKGLIFFLEQAAPAAGHVSLVQEVFARNLVFARPKGETTAATLASHEDTDLLCIEAVSTVLTSQQKHGGVLSQHAQAAPFAALVLRTLLERVAAERSTQIRVAALRCLHLVWTVIPVDIVVGFLPGTVSELCKLLQTSTDKKMSSKVVQGALTLLSTALVLTCDDARLKRELDTLDSETGHDKYGQVATSSASPAEMLRRLVSGQRCPGAPEDGMVRARKEGEALNSVACDVTWVRTARAKLSQALTVLFDGVCACSGHGQVNADAHPHLARFADVCEQVLKRCRRVLRPIVPLMVEVVLLNASAEGDGEAAALVTPAASVAAREFAAASSGQHFRQHLDRLSTGLARRPDHAIAIAGWVQHIVQEDTPQTLSLISDGFTMELLRGMVRAAASVGSSDYQAFSKRHGSVLGALRVLCQALATYANLPEVVGILIADLHDFSRWRMHHPTVWILKGVVYRSHRNVFLRTPADLSDVLIGVVAAFTESPEQWYFQDQGVGVAEVTHCTVLCRLMLETIADASHALFEYDGGVVRTMRLRDQFLFRTVYAVVEKVPSPHRDVADAATGVLSVVAKSYRTDVGGSDGVALMLLECFDWIVDAVIARLPFIADYPETPGMLASLLRLLEGLLGPHGASDELLTMLHHVLHGVTDTLLSLERKLRSDAGVFAMLSSIAALLARSARLKQATLAENQLYPNGAALAAVAIAACCAAAHIAPPRVSEEEEDPHGSTNQPEACSEEALWCKQERAMGMDVLEKVKHHVTSENVRDHRVLCEGVRACVLLFCTYDGVSDRLQGGRRTDAPTPVVHDGIVVDLAGEWIQRVANGDECFAAPLYTGGLCTSALNKLHCLWAGLVARLLPPGFTAVGELTQRLTKEHQAHLNSTGVRQRLRKFMLPTVDVGLCVRHVTDVAVTFLVYVRDFMEDRIRNELWPLLKYHLVLSPHIFHECPGARASHIATTSLFKFQRSCLVLLHAMFQDSLRDGVLRARANPELYKHSAVRPGALQQLFSDIIATTERFLDKRQPPALSRVAEALHARLNKIIASSDDSVQPTPAGACLV
eukprot:Rhum_TRINITY_DN24843_c0_g1::Rhum_TRINITY_DN24843_c0_g1_i1::g.180149::m.180149